MSTQQEKQNRLRPHHHRVGQGKSEQQRHRGRRRNIFPFVCLLIAALVLLFIGSAIAAIVMSGIEHFGEAITSEEVRFSLLMSVITSSISTVICLLLALPTAYALSHVAFPGKRIA